jgi:hypothetical protein
MSNDTLSCCPTDGHPNGHHALNGKMRWNNHVRVRFNAVDEFLEELKEARPTLEPVLRLTTEYMTRGDVPITGVTVVAGYLRVLPDGHLNLVELRRFCGERHVHETEKTKVDLRAAEVVAEIEGAVLVMNKQGGCALPATDVNYVPPILVRAGRYEL